MSIRIMTKVWDNARNIKSDRLIVLLALADWADDSGKCYPKMPSIAWKARVTENGARGIVKALEEDGYLTVIRGRGRGNQNEYIVHPNGDANHEKQSENEVVNPEIYPEFEPENGALKPPSTKGFPQKGFDKRVSSTLKPPSTKGFSERPKKPSTYKDRGHLLEPSVLQPSVEPSGERASARNAPPPEKSVCKHSLESPLAKQIRAICKKGIMLSQRDQRELQEVLTALSMENATPEQAAEFGRKVHLHWIGRDGRTGAPRAPRIIQVLEHWHEVLSLDETAEALSKLSTSTGGNREHRSITNLRESLIYN